MPCAFSERIRRKISTAFEQFSDSAAHCIGVYTAADYIDIMKIDDEMGN
jgi:hypothetical protein